MGPSLWTAGLCRDAEHNDKMSQSHHGSEKSWAPGDLSELVAVFKHLWHMGVAMSSVTMIENLWLFLLF